MKLLDLFIEFAAKGLGDVKSAMETVRDDAAATTAVIKVLGAGATASFAASSSTALVFVGSVTAVGTALTVVAAAAGGTTGRMLALAGTTAVATAALVTAVGVVKTLDTSLKQLGGGGGGGGLLAIGNQAGGASQLIKIGFNEAGKEKDKFDENLKKHGKSWELFTKIAGFAKWAVLGLTGTLTGFVTAGLVGTGLGQQLSFQMGQLSRTISGMLRPEIDMLVNGIRSLTDWLRSLTDEQKESLIYWGKVTIVVLGVVAILPAVISGLKLVAAAWGQVGLSATYAAVATGIAERNMGKVALALALPIAAAAAGAYALKKVVDFITPGTGPGGRGPMEPAGGAIRSIQDTYKAIQESAYDSIPAKTLAEAERHTRLLEELNARWADLKPALAP